MTTLTVELATLDATAQAELVRRREVTPTELVEAAIERIETLNPTLNAVVTPTFDRPCVPPKGHRRVRSPASRTC